MYQSRGAITVFSRPAVVVTCLCCLALALGWPLAAQESAAGSGDKVAVIDVQRLLTESKAGQAALNTLRTESERKTVDLETKQQEIADLRARISEGQLSLSEERLLELQKELEDEAIAFSRMQDDADRDLQKRRDDVFADIERQVMPIITQVGKEMGFSLIFNKYQSGLLFAEDHVDITAQVLARYDQGYKGD